MISFSPIDKSVVCLFVCLFLTSQAYGADMKKFYAVQEAVCVKRGWKKIEFSVAGAKRQLLWEAPQGVWKHGAIIVLHGGGGSYTNWCGDMRASQPMYEFSKLAVERGFGVFALDSTDGLFRDAAGNSCGKRFDFTAGQQAGNLELPFFDEVIRKIIPALRPQGSARDIFMVGISNGGFMTFRAATHFDDELSAFALVSAGDAYGAYIDCQDDLTVREGAPGLFYDNETGVNIGKDDACLADAYPREITWDSAYPAKKPACKQFHHEGDSGVDISCMRKAQRQLIAHGYPVGAPYIIKERNNDKKLWKHFWQRQYNEPLIEFFIEQKNRP